MRKLILLFPLFAILTISCITSRSLSKKAIILEDAGEYTAAADLFYQSIIKKSTNTDAIIGLKRTGKKVINDRLREFSKYALQEKYEEATYSYLAAEKYQAKLARVRVRIEIPTISQEKYNEVLNQYLSKKYERGLSFINIEEFDKAEKCFNEIYKFDKTYKDVSELRNIAYLEPFYRKAEKLKNNKEYRDAYDAYSKILQRVGNYKDTKKHRDYVLAKGQTYITLSSDNDKRYSSYSNSIKQQVVNSIFKIKDPFIKVVDREDLSRVLKEQELSLSGLSKNDIDVGEIASAQYNVVINVTDYSSSREPLRKEKVKAREAYKEKYYGEDGKARYRTKFKTVYYYEYQESRNLVMSTSYRVISLSTSEIVATDIVRRSLNSHVHYITYSGNKNELYPAVSSNGYSSASSRSTLKKLLKAPRTLKSLGVLTEQYNRYAADRIAASIISKLR